MDDAIIEQIAAEELKNSLAFRQAKGYRDMRGQAKSERVKRRPLEKSRRKTRKASQRRNRA